MTQELYQKALRFAGEKHRNQKVPGTQANYLLHISNVAMEILLAYQNGDKFDLDFALQVAILHDTLEDTDTEFKELEEGFGEKVALGVLALTKNDIFTSKTEKMLDSLNRIHALEDEVAMVKLADRITNLQEPPKHWSTEKIITYLEEAKLIYKILGNKNTYLGERLSDRILAYNKFTN